MNNKKKKKKKKKVVYSEKDSDISFGSISECSEIDRNKSLNSNLSTLLNFTPFKRYNFSGNREDLESSFQWEDVEKKFQQVLLANDFNDDFDELVNSCDCSALFSFPASSGIESVFSDLKPVDILLIASLTTMTACRPMSQLGSLPL